jgi:hypothetical protein
MNRGVLLVANNNKSIDYILQACFLARSVKKYLKLPVTLVTDTPAYVKNNYPMYENLFDTIIDYTPASEYTIKTYRDGLFIDKQLEFKNSSRSSVFNLTPYDETIVLDTDILLFNDDFLKCFEQRHDLLMYKHAVDLANKNSSKDFKFISDSSVEFYWATCVFFRKTNENKIFFDLIKHIQENWNHYRLLYQISSGVFRNDFAFSIATHIMNGMASGDFVKEFPGSLIYATDKSELVEITDDSVLLLLEHPSKIGNYTPIKVKNTNIHFMNKFSLDRLLKNDN